MAGRVAERGRESSMGQRYRTLFRARQECGGLGVGNPGSRLAG
jgi:hypothetical protein